MTWLTVMSKQTYIYTKIHRANDGYAMLLPLDRHAAPNFKQKRIKIFWVQAQTPQNMKVFAPLGIMKGLSVLKSSALYLLSRGLGEPLRAFIKAIVGLVEAAASSDVTDWQGAGAAVDVVVTAGGLRQRAAGVGEAVAKVLAHAAAGASCTQTSVCSSAIDSCRPQYANRQICHR